MSREESQPYLHSQFSRPLQTDLADSTAGAIAVLLSAAIDSRYGRQVDASTVYQVLVRKSGSTSAVNMLHVKRTLEELGYGAIAFAGHAQDYRNYKRVMALGFGMNIFLLAGVDNNVVYTVNPNGTVCQMDYRSFRETSMTVPLMFLKSSP